MYFHSEQSKKIELTERLSNMSDRYERSHKHDEKCITICETECDHIADEAAAIAAAAADAAEECVETRTRRQEDFSDPVCVDTTQIYDSCRDRDCVSNTRVYISKCDQELVEAATNVKLKRAEIIWVYTNIEPLSFNNGYFSVDMKFYVNVTLEIFSGLCNPTIIHGLSMFDKRVILFGSEGNSKVFKSNSNLGTSCELASCWQNTSLPTVVVEAVEPVALSARIVEPRHHCDCCDCCDCNEECTTTSSCPGGHSRMFPRNICDCFDGDLLVCDDIRRIEVSFGLFSIVRLERDSQLLLDAVDFCIPTQECPSATEENPCSLFNDIRFPIDEFFPPQKGNDDSGSSHCHKHNGCGRNCRCN